MVDGPTWEHHRRTIRFAAMMLALSCVFWGGSFTWQKLCSNSVNAAAQVSLSHPLGPMLVLGWRFLIAGLLWMIFIPRARRGWTADAVRRSAILGLLFGAGIVLQATGLAITTATVSAFLTSLTIIFVPLLMAVAIRKPPAGAMWLGVAIATAGIWLMTGGTGGFGLGEVLGLGCALVFSFYLIALNMLCVNESPWRISGGQNLTIGVCALLAVLILYPGRLDAQVLLAPFTPPALWNMLLLILLPTMLAGAIMVFYQPKLDPTRAAMIYLTEPIFAAGFAFALNNERMGWVEMLGAVLILLANAWAEWWQMGRAPKAVPA